MTNANVIPIERDCSLHSKSRRSNTRKKGVNRNKKGSVRNINGKIYVDFYYLGERVRETSNLVWNEANVKTVRRQLDRIHSSLESGTFRFSEVFPHSRRKDHFLSLEQTLFRAELQPRQVLLSDYIPLWYDLVRSSGRVTERTLLHYRELIRNYLEPFFGERLFSDLNLIAYDQFFSWARNQRYRGFSVCNATLNKCMTVLKMVCKSAQIYYGWRNGFDPFAGCKKLPVEDPYEKVNPFSIAEQNRLIQALPDHWKPYFKFAFCIGLRQGEQIGLKPDDIDWDNQILTIRRAMTRDEHGRPVEGRTKNKYSRRSIKLLPVMMEPLIEQRCIADQFESAEYFFCTPTGSRIHPSNFRRRVWIPALQKAHLEIRDMRQTRHSFATNALSCGENPLWIASVLGHRNTEMIIKVYSKYVEKSHGSRDGQSFNALYQVNIGNSR